MLAVGLLQWGHRDVIVCRTVVGSHALCVALRNQTQALREGLAMRKVVLALLLLLGVMNCGFLALNYRSDLPLSIVREAYADNASQFLAVDGAMLHVKDEGSGPPLVLIHGTASSLHTWDGWTNALREQARVIRFDLPGFGLTGPNADADYSVTRSVRTLDALLDRLGVDQPVDLAGNSLGGWIAWRYALAHPARVRKLVLVDAAGYASIDGSATVLEAGRVPVVKRLLRKVTPRALVASGLQDVYANDALVTPELIERHYRLLLREGNRDALVARLATPWEDHEAEIPKITQPTLVMWGAHDTWIPPAVAERFVADLPNAELRIYANAGHVPHEELPEETAHDLRAFLGASSASD